MSSLLDIGPLTDQVEIRGNKITVQGLSAGHLFQLFNDFPEMRKMFDSKGDAKEVFLSLAPELIAKVIAMATGKPHDKQAEMQAMALGAWEQGVILLAVQQMTFPRGIGPFVDMVTKLMTSTSSVSTESKTGTPDSESSMIDSPAQFSASLQMDTPGMLHGRARRVN
jgi:hypothetical protein